MSGIAGWVVAALICAGPAFPAGVDDAPQTDRQTIEVFPQGQLFRPLVADPKTPRFETSVLWTRATARNTTAWAVAFGESFGLVRWSGKGAGDGVQLDVAGAVLAQFDLLTPSVDLVNADYVIGLPLSYRRSGFSARLRVYHQSSHLGDEYLLRVHPQRINLSFESFEALASYDRRSWRAYGGGEYLFARDPRDLAARMLHAGVEYRGDPLVRIGDLGIARFVAAVDAKAWEQQDWRPGWSGKAGLEFGAARGSGSGRHLSVLAEYYDGPSPYGQFYGQDVRYAGFGVTFSF